VTLPDIRSEINTVGKRRRRQLRLWFQTTSEATHVPHCGDAGSESSPACLSTFWSLLAPTSLGLESAP